MVTPEEAAQMCNRNFGIGGDGVSRRLLPGACISFVHLHKWRMKDPIPY